MNPSSARESGRRHRRSLLPYTLLLVATLGPWLLAFRASTRFMFLAVAGSSIASVHRIRKRDVQAPAQPPTWTPIIAIAFACGIAQLTASLIEPMLRMHHGGATVFAPRPSTEQYWFALFWLAPLLLLHQTTAQCPGVPKRPLKRVSWVVVMGGLLIAIAHFSVLNHVNAVEDHHVATRRALESASPGTE